MKTILIAATIGTLTLGGSAAFAQSSSDAVSGTALHEMALGNNWIGTNLQKRAASDDATVQNRFNLATGYQRTTRIATAKRYYQALATDGAGTILTSSERGRSFDAGMAAADRLLYIDWLQNGATRRSGVVAADAAGSDVSATVGGSGDYEVTDDQARALDRRAHAQ